MGNVFDSVLVDSDEIASKCIRILKDKQAGSLQFICCNKIQHMEQYMNQPFTAPARSQRLFDLCKFQFEKAKLGFFFALNNSLVCNSIGDAKNINNSSQQKFKILTLEGVTLHPNGSLQGGGQAKTGMVNTGSRINYNTSQMAENYKNEQKKMAQLSEAL